MTSYWMSRRTIVGLAVAVLSFPGLAIGRATAASLPKNPCLLLTPADLQVLPPSAKIANGTVDTSSAPLGISCTYTWGPRTREWGQTTLTITVIDTSKAWAGRSSDSIKQSLLAKAKNDGLNASEIRGVGDAAVFRFESRLSSATAESYFKAKALHLSVVFHSGDALPSKNKVIALLKKAAERL